MGEFHECWEKDVIQLWHGLFRDGKVRATNVRLRDPKIEPRANPLDHSLRYQVEVG